MALGATGECLVVGHPVTLALPMAVDDEVATSSAATENPIGQPGRRRSRRAGRVPRPDGGRVAGRERRFAHVVDGLTRRAWVRHEFAGDHWGDGDEIRRLFGHVVSLALQSGPHNGGDQSARPMGATPGLIVVEWER